MEATTAYRVGVTLGLKLEANGYRVEATGEVRVSYPSLGMGISFTKMSDEDRERLRDLHAFDLAAFRDPGRARRDACSLNGVSRDVARGGKPGGHSAGDLELLRRPPHDGPRRISKDSAQESVAGFSSQFSVLSSKF